MRGPEISVDMSSTWQKTAGSECRLSMMVELRRMNIGFGDMENFDIAINSKFRSKYYRERVNDKGSQSNIVREAMQIIVRDEEKYLTELYKQREKMRKDLARIHSKNSRTYRRILKTLKIEANKISQEMTHKYKNKIEHLRRKYREDDIDRIKK